MVLSRTWENLSGHGAPTYRRGERKFSLERSPASLGQDKRCGEKQGKTAAEQENGGAVAEDFYRIKYFLDNVEYRYDRRQE